ncbi:GntR family transcriptional regulator [Pseudohoeflea suaedae]|uniref:GntR family transcriptional regulator n=1 Tax=Pseudohoeflea suaedae TaxID=877384 RepID=A0A4R5PPM5_9HYPH|nr:helix-turn-helix domain-containing protein [Pseudohoeflea suaedae]TDH38567.1 GntR family transcriptional regulator [Pseudohoeflea suaedae]
MTEEISEAERQSFTSWKLDVLDAMSCDPNVRDIDYRVAFRLMQHVNARAKEARPSIERLAAQIGVSRDTVRRSLTRLSEPDGGCHWLHRIRIDRTQPYFYTFVTERVGVILDAKADREDRAREAARQRRQNQSEVAPLLPREVANDTGVEVANGDDFEVATLPPKHLRENYLNRTPVDSSLSEREDLSCGTVFPTEETEFAVWIFQHIPDRAHHREALRLLRAGQMTTEIYRRMAA